MLFKPDNSSDLSMLNAEVSQVEEAHSYKAILLILISGLLLRILGGYFFHGIIDTEGAEYARIAENLISGGGYVGISTPGTQLFFPPLFPILIAAGSFISGDMETGGMLVSILAGTSLIWSTFLITRYLYDQPTGIVSAILVACHPLLIGWSISLYCESAFLSLAMPGLYFGLRAMREPRLSLFAIAGSFFGAAYLIRQEAVLYPILLAGAAGIHILLTNKAKIWFVLFRSSAAVAAFLLLAVPYIIWLSVNIGGFHLEGKSALNIATGERVISGMTGYEASFAIDDQLNERGIFLQPNLAVIEAMHQHPTSLLSYLKAKAVQTIWRITRTISFGLPLGAPIVTILAIFGLVHTSWGRQTSTPHIFLFSILVTSLLSLFFIYYASVRFFIVVLAIVLIWASHGLCELSRRVAAATTAYFPRQPLSSRLAQQGVIGSGVAALMLIAFFGSKHLGELRNFDYASQPIKVAGEWLRNQKSERITIADTWTPLAFHARAAFVWLPYTNSTNALRYIDRHHVDYIVISDRDQSTTPYLKDWIKNGIPDSRAQLVYHTFVSPIIGSISIYRWESGDGPRAQSVARHQVET